MDEDKKCEKRRMRFMDFVTNRPGAEMQCEQTDDWPSIGARLLSLAKLVALNMSATSIMRLPGT